MKKKGDYVQVVTQSRTGVLSRHWINPKNLKKYEFSRKHDKKTHKLIDVATPKLKISKPKKGGGFGGLGGGLHEPVKLTLHIKIVYDKETSNKFLPVWKEFYLEGRISGECYAEDIPPKAAQMEAALKEKLRSQFFSSDARQTLLSNPYYGFDNAFESGIERDIIEDTPRSGLTDAEADYRYARSGILRTKKL
jgi:hypothetical protein